LAVDGSTGSHGTYLGVTQTPRKKPSVTPGSYKVSLSGLAVNTFFTDFHKIHPRTGTGNTMRLLGLHDLEANGSLLYTIFCKFMVEISARGLNQNPPSGAKAPRT